MATNNEEIIERKEGSPVATSCLIIACVAILGAISLQIAALTQQRDAKDRQSANTVPSSVLRHVSLPFSYR